MNHITLGHMPPILGILIYLFIFCLLLDNNKNQAYGAHFRVLLVLCNNKIRGNGNPISGMA